ncbi:hypothetical protein D3C87_1524970 [compost metagenome]
MRQGNGLPGFPGLCLRRHPPPRSARILRDHRRQLHHAPGQPACQGRQSEQRAAPDEQGATVRTDHGPRCGLRAAGQLPQARRRPVQKPAYRHRPDTAVLLQRRPDPAQSAHRVELRRRSAGVFRYVPTGQGRGGMRLLRRHQLRRAPLHGQRDRRLPA